MIDEEADAAAHFKGREQDAERPADARWPEWSGYLQVAWHVLRDDRFYGAMGGAARIYYAALDRYAARHRIEGQAFDEFQTLIFAMDAEYLDHLAEQAKQTEAKTKQT